MNRGLSWALQLDVVDEGSKPLLSFARTAERTKQQAVKAADAAAKAQEESGRKTRDTLGKTEVALRGAGTNAQHTGLEFEGLSTKEKRAAIEAQKLDNNWSQLSVRALKLEGDLGRAARANNGLADAQQDAADAVGALDLGAAKAGLAGAGITAGAAFSAALASSIDIEQGRVVLGVQLGLTKEESRRAGKIAGALYRDNYGDSLEGVNDAIVAVGQNIDQLSRLTNGEIEGAAGTVLNLGKVFGAESQELTRTAGQLVRSGMAKDVNQAFDLITVGFQRGADKGGEFLDTLNEYSAPMKALGLDARDFTGLIVEGADAGAYSVDKIGDAFKELRIRATDGSTGTKTAFKQLGLDADTYATRIAKGGPAAKKATDEILKQIRKLGPGSKQDQVIAALFGGPGEDLTSEVITKLRPVSKELGKTKGAADDLGKALGDTNATKIETFKRGLQTGLTDVMANDVIPALEDGYEAGKPYIKMFGNAARAAAKFGDEHPGLMKVAAGVVAVGVGLKTIKFAGAITGVTSLVRGLAKLGGVGRSAGGKLGDALGDELVDAATTRSRSGLSRSGALTGGGVRGRMGSVGRTLGGDLGSELGQHGASTATREIGKNGALTGKLRGRMASVGGSLGSVIGVAMAAYAINDFLHDMAGAGLQDVVRKFREGMSLDGLPGLPGSHSSGDGSSRRKPTGNAKTAAPGTTAPLVPPNRYNRGNTGGRLALDGFRRYQDGGLVPALVSPGEQIEYGGQAMIVPGARVAADTVPMMLPVGATVWTDHGQALRAAGVPDHEALEQQLPHFREGGPVQRFDKGGKAKRRGKTTRTAKVGFSVYDDPGAGAFGRGLAGGYAELGTATRAGKGTGHGWLAKSLGLSGELKAGQALSVRINGHEKTLRKKDRGYGQGGNGVTSDPHYALDVWRDSWSTFGLNRNSKGTATVALNGTAPAGASTSSSDGTTSVTVPRILGRSTTRARDAMSAALSAGLERGEGWTRADVAAYGNPYLQTLREELDEARDGYTRQVELKYRTSTTAAPTAKGLRKAAGPVTPRVAKMIDWAASAATKWPRYSYAGGHATLGQGTGGQKGPGFDCSGFVSGILAAGKFTGSVMSTDQLKGWGQSGDGKQITVGVRGSTGRAAHTMVQLGKTFWEAGSRGVGRRTSWSGSFPIHRHPRGYRGGGLVGVPRPVVVRAPAPARIALERAGTRALDPTSTDFVGWGYRHGGAVQRFRGGGTPSITSTVAPLPGRSTSALDQVLRSTTDKHLAALDAQVAAMGASRLDGLRRYLAEGVDRGGDAKANARVTAALKKVTEEIGFRIARRAANIGGRLERASGTVEAVGERLASGGIDTSSIQGRVATIDATRSAQRQAQAAQAQAQRDLERATKNTDKLKPADQKAAIEVARQQLKAAGDAAMSFGGALINAQNDLARNRPKLEAEARDAQVGMLGALAGLTAGSDDDRYAATLRRDEAARQLNDASRIGDVEWITKAAGDLANAADSLRSIERGAVDEQLDYRQAEADLTEDTADDRQVAEDRRAEALRRLADARERGDTKDATEQLRTLKSIDDTLKSLDTTTQEQLDAANTANDMLKQQLENAQRALVGVAAQRDTYAGLSSTMGQNVVRSAATPGVAAGGVTY